MNSLKSNFNLAEVNFTLHDKGFLAEWDGMIGWYKNYIDQKPVILSDPYISQWHKALLRCENYL
ncbi:MAG: hypothetical protein JXR63_08300 [Spirochaetales bacterium]|nr:hypothetical protein [Spirochaetales bacterium]